MKQYFISTINKAAPFNSWKLVIPPSTFLNLVGMGDSNMYGYDVTTDQRWLKLSAVALGVTEVNHGLQASFLANNYINTVPTGIENYQSYIQGDSKYVIALGTNDLNNGITLSDFEVDYDSIINNLLFFYLPENIIVCNIPWINTAGRYLSWSQIRHDDFNEVIERQSIDKGVKFCDFYSATYNHDEYLDADDLHYNATGHVVLKNTFLASM